MAGTVTTLPTRSRTALAAVLTVLTLVPSGYLFSRVWTDNADARDNVRLERQGVQYLTALNPLISALAEAQSSALSGVSATPPALTTAVTAVSGADQRLGAALGTRERWAGLRDRIARLSGVSGNALAVYSAHVEATDLALALYGTVRNNSTLVRDQYNDVSHLQQATAVDLPGAVVHVSRMGDLSLLLAGAGQAQRTVVAPLFGAEVAQVNMSVSNLTDNLQAAVDETRSATLSGNLVSSLDSFRRGVESLTRGANPGGTPDASTMATAQTQLQSSLRGLAGVILREMDALLADRLDALDRRRAGALAAVGAAVLLALAALTLLLLARRRAAPAPPARPGETTRDLRDPRAPQVVPPFDPPPYGGGDPTRREQSGALR